MKFRWPAPQVGRFSSSSGRASVTTNSGLSRDHSSRYSTKSSSEASAHCMSSKARIVGYASASRSKNSRQAANRSCRSCEAPSPSASSCASLGSTNRRSSGSSRCSSSAACKLPQRLVLWLVLGDPAAPPHHVRERPVGHAFAVGETAAAVPVDRLDDPVEVLVELPREPRLADAGDAGHRDQLRPPSSAQTWNRSLICRSSRSRPTNGASRPSDFSDPAAPRRRAARATAASRPPCP